MDDCGNILSMQNVKVSAQPRCPLAGCFRFGRLLQTPTLRPEARWQAASGRLLWPEGRLLHVQPGCLRSGCFGPVTLGPEAWDSFSLPPADGTLLD